MHSSLLHLLELVNIVLDHRIKIVVVVLLLFGFPLFPTVIIIS